MGEFVFFLGEDLLELPEVSIVVVEEETLGCHPAYLILQRKQFSQPIETLIILMYLLHESSRSPNINNIMHNMISPYVLPNQQQIIISMCIT